MSKSQLSHSEEIQNAVYDLQLYAASLHELSGVMIQAEKDCAIWSIVETLGLQIDAGLEQIGTALIKEAKTEQPAAGAGGAR